MLDDLVQRLAVVRHVVVVAVNDVPVDQRDRHAVLGAFRNLLVKAEAVARTRSSFYGGE